MGSSRLAALRQKLRDDAGVTLLEVVIALVLLGLLAGSILKIAGVSSQWGRMAQRQYQASVLAFGILDYYRTNPEWLAAEPFGGEDATELLFDEPMADSNYSWQVYYQPYNLEANLMEVGVTVNWDDEKTVEMWTLLYIPP